LAIDVKAFQELLVCTGVQFFLHLLTIFKFLWVSICTVRMSEGDLGEENMEEDVLLPLMEASQVDLEVLLFGNEIS
jgi:hypothetical protein